MLITFTIPATGHVVVIRLVDKLIDDHVWDQVMPLFIHAGPLQ